MNIPTIEEYIDSCYKRCQEIEAAIESGDLSMDDEIVDAEYKANKHNCMFMDTKRKFQEDYHRVRKALDDCTD